MFILFQRISIFIAEKSNKSDNCLIIYLYLLNRLTNNLTIALKKTAYFAGGCFWCTEAIYTRVDGVETVEPGYMGGTIKNPAYREVCTGRTGHAEAIKVVFDEVQISYDVLVSIFFSTHDPTTLNRQGADVGTQYRSAIFCVDETQFNTATRIVDELTDQKIFSDPIVTEIAREQPFYPAEKDHHNYFNKNGEQPYCQAIIAPKVEKFIAQYKTHLK